MEGTKCFCNGVNSVYGDEALWHQTLDNINRLLDEGKAAGIPGYIGSIDCIHWHWKNCPSTWKGVFQGEEEVLTVSLEATVNFSTRSWHFTFGSPGALNDINVLDPSPLFYNAVRGEAPRIDFTVTCHQHSVTYWLVDGIYLTYACFVKTIPNATTRMQNFCVTAQEAKQKDIECAFSLLQSCFHILTTAGCCLWDCEAMDTMISTCCVVLHNLIFDYKREHNVDGRFINDVNYVPLHCMVLVPCNPNQAVEEREVLMASVQNMEQHNLL